MWVVIFWVAMGICAIGFGWLFYEYYLTVKRSYADDRAARERDRQMREAKTGARERGPGEG